MKFELYFYNTRWHDEDNRLVTFCANIMSKVFKMVPEKKYRMTVRFKNPRQAGWIAVRLTRSSFSKIWCWHIGDNTSQDDDVFLHDYMDDMLSLHFGTVGAMDETVWVKVSQTA